MRILLALAIAGFLWPSIGLAQGCGPTNPNCVVPDRPPGDVSNSAANTRFVGAGNTANVLNFGARGDGVTDDTAAINNAIAYAHTLGTAFVKPVMILFPPGRYIVCDTINMTGWFNVNYAVTLSGYGAVISTCGAWPSPDGTFPTGRAVIDMRGSTNVHVEGISVLAFGNGTVNSPSVGIQIGKINSNIASQNSFLDVSVSGTYMYGAFYNVGSENNSYVNLTLTNANLNTLTGSLRTAILILDGMNHYNLSTVAASTVTPNTHLSFIGNNFVGGRFLTAGAPGTVPSVPIWISQDAETVSFRNTYINTGGTECVWIYGKDSSTAAAWNWSFDIGCEGANVTSWFMFTGTHATPYLQGFTFTTPAICMKAGAEIFKLDPTSSVVSGRLNDMSVHIAAWPTGASCVPASNTVFDNPANWTASGLYASANTPQWNVPATFSGTVCLGDGLCEFYPLNTTVGALGTCNAALSGARRLVTDQNGAPVYNAAPAGGGGVKQIVFCDGTSWTLR